MNTLDFFSGLYESINNILWPFIRIIAVFITAPVYNETAINSKVKTGLAILMTLLVYPMLPADNIAIFSWQGIATGIIQFIIGMMIGLGLQVVFIAIRYAGELISLQMGLSFATFYDSHYGQTMPVISRILNILAVLLFFCFDGHLLLIEILAGSFYIVPIRQSILSVEGIISLIDMSKLIFSSGLKFALPVVILLLCINFSLGILNRIIPQLSIFVVGFPLSLTLGMLALSFSLFLLSPFFEIALEENFEALLSMLHRLR